MGGFGVEIQLESLNPKPKTSKTQTKAETPPRSDAEDRSKDSTSDRRTAHDILPQESCLWDVMIFRVKAGDGISDF